MQSPFRPLRSGKRNKARTPNQLPEGETACPRHPRSWVEKKVFFVTKKRECPYCELESYAPINPDAPMAPPLCEAGFGGFAPPEPKPSRTPRPRQPTPRSRAPATPRSAGGRGGTPRSAAGGRSGTPRSAAGGRSGTPRSAAGGRGGTPRDVGAPGADTPRARGTGAEGTPRQNMPTPRTATVRRTAVFNPTQTSTERRTAVFHPTQPSRHEPEGRPPRGTGSLSYNVQGGRGTPRSRHHRSSSASSSISSASTSSTKSSHRRIASRERSSPKPQAATTPRTPSSSKRSVERVPRQVSPSPPSSEDDADKANSPTGIPPVEPAHTYSTPKRSARSLMFTSAARKRGAGGSNLATSMNSSADRGSSGRAIVPPSPSGSMLSDFSTIGNDSGVYRWSSDRHVPIPPNLVLPPTIPATEGGETGPVGKMPAPSLRNLAGSEEYIVPGAGQSIGGGDSAVGAGTTQAVAVAGASNAVPRSSVPTRLDGDTTTQSSSTIATVSASPQAVLEAVERAEPEPVRRRVRPVAMAIVKLAEAVAALAPRQVDESQGADAVHRILEATRKASGVVREARVLTAEEGGDGQGRGLDHEDEDEAEAAGAVLAEATLSVEVLAQMARALMWSGKSPLHLHASATYTKRHNTATSAVKESTSRAELLLKTLVVPSEGVVGQGARDIAAAQRRWFSVLDRHEAWTRRRDSRKALLTTEPEISSGAVTVFKDCQLLPEGSLGTTYAAEYLGLPVAATVLATNASSSNKATVNVTGADDDAIAVHELAAAEIRDLSSHVPAHPRLARTHGSETITPGVSIHGLDGDGQEGEGVGKTNASLVLVSDLVEGGTLRDRIAAESSVITAANMESAVAGLDGPEAGAGGPLTANGKGSSRGGDDCVDEIGARGGAERFSLKRRRVLADVAEGLACLHERGVYHGALSADTVLLDADGRAKLSMFGLPQTRKAVAAMIRASAVKGRLAADSPMNQSGGIASAERDGSVDENVSEDSADVDGSVESLASQRAWTPPEALGTETAAAEGTKGFQKEDDQKAGEAADSYALGMIAWEVLTGRKPWEGTDVDDMVVRVMHGERPPLPFQSISLDGLNGFTDLVRLLWAQDPTARPAMHDVAKRLRVAEPRQASPTAASAAIGVAGMGEVYAPLPVVDGGRNGVGGEGKDEREEQDADEVTEHSKFKAKSLTELPPLIATPAVNSTMIAAFSDTDESVSTSNGVFGSPRVTGDEAGCPSADSACGGTPTPSGGGGGEMKPDAEPMYGTVQDAALMGNGVDGGRCGKSDQHQENGASETSPTKLFERYSGGDKQPTEGSLNVDGKERSLDDGGRAHVVGNGNSSSSSTVTGSSSSADGPCDGDGGEGQDFFGAVTAALSATVTSWSAANSGSEDSGNGGIDGNDRDSSGAALPIPAPPRSSAPSPNYGSNGDGGKFFAPIVSSSPIMSFDAEPSPREELDHKIAASAGKGNDGAEIRLLKQPSIAPAVVGEGRYDDDPQPELYREGSGEDFFSASEGSPHRSSAAGADSPVLSSTAAPMTMAASSPSKACRTPTSIPSPSTRPRSISGGMASSTAQLAGTTACASPDGTATADDIARAYVDSVVDPSGDTDTPPPPYTPSLNAHELFINPRGGDGITCTPQGRPQSMPHQRSNVTAPVASVETRTSPILLTPKVSGSTRGSKVLGSGTRSAWQIKGGEGSHGQSRVGSVSPVAGSASRAVPSTPARIRAAGAKLRNMASTLPGFGKKQTSGFSTGGNKGGAKGKGVTSFAVEHR